MLSLQLTAQGIVTATEKTGEFLAGKGLERKDLLRIQLAAEEVLLSFQQALGESASLNIYFEKRFGTPRVIFRIPGASFDPFSALTDEDRLMHNLMENMGTAPVWNYRHSSNEIVFTVKEKKKISATAKIIIAVILGIGLGLLARLLPGTTAHDICADWLSPVQNAIMGLLGCLSALFILFSIASGICGMGDITTFNRIGRKLIITLLLDLLVVVAVASVFLIFFFPPSNSGADQSADFASLWQTIINIIPTNLVEMFSSGNTIQIVFLAVFSSVILLIMGPKAQQLVDIISHLNDLLQKLIQGVINFMPLVVFISLFVINADGDIGQLFHAVQYPFYLLILCIIYLIVKVSIASIKYHISPLLLMRKLSSTMAITLSTSSSAAAMTENMNTCENRLGVDHQVVSLGVTLGQTIYMPSAAITYICAILCAAQIFNVPITLSSFIILAFSAYILSVATPSMPGATMAIFTLLITQMGIPTAAMAFLIALDPITDRISTCTQVSGLQITLIDIANSLNILDKEKLTAEN